MSRQSPANKLGEIEFRRKLVRQQVGGERLFSDEYDSVKIESILRERMSTTKRQMAKLKEAGTCLAPYLEIGSERCQRSLVMENELGSSGIALDISFEMLDSCEHYRGLFGMDKNPARVCADAYSLPLAADSIPFVFCYETLHHFPDPAPVVEEIYRVLAPGGVFFFDEEPYKRMLHLNAYKSVRRSPVNPGRAAKVRSAVDYFLAKRVCNEEMYGIIEQHDIKVRSWTRALDVFEEAELRLVLPGSIEVDPLAGRGSLRYLLAYLLGGKISGTCRKEGVPGLSGSDDPFRLTICPECMRTGKECSLKQEEAALVCGQCGGHFPLVNGVAFLFSRNSLEELYPWAVKEPR